MKNWHRTIFLCFVFFSHMTITAGQQESMYPKTMSQGLSLGLGHMQIRENILHPKVHRGLNYALQYSNRSSRTGFIPSFQTSLGFSQLGTRLEDKAASFNIQLAVDMDWELLREDISPSILFSIGPALGMIWDLSLYPNWDESHLYWATSYNLGLNAMFEWHGNNGQMIRWISHIPAISLSGRPPAYRDFKLDEISFSGIIHSMHRDMEIGTWNLNTFYHGLLEYRIWTGSKIDHGFSYSFKIQRQKSTDALSYVKVSHLFSYIMFL